MVSDDENALSRPTRDSFHRRICIIKIWNKNKIDIATERMVKKCDILYSKTTTPMTYFITVPATSFFFFVIDILSFDIISV